MILFAGLIVFGLIFPSAFAVIMRIVAITFLIPLAFFGTGVVAFSLAFLFVLRILSGLINSTHSSHDVMVEGWSTMRPW
jgi:hypothetical protein